MRAGFLPTEDMAAWLSAVNGQGDLFRRWTVSELLTEDREFRWLVEGLLVRPTFGPIGGAEKTLKSHVMGLIAVAVAAGVPVLDRFKVPEPVPVVGYVGEGGRIPWTNRLLRIGEALGVKLDDLPLEVTFDVAPVDSDRFRKSLERDLKELQPGLVWLDPLYAYHGAAKASDLYERGPMLHRLSASVVEAGASLLVVDHWNKTGSGTGLDRMTQAGMKEWADTWLLLRHRRAPEVALGNFSLALEVGSRQWGGSQWDLDLFVGQFDEERGDYVTPLGWRLDPAMHTADEDVRENKDEVALRIVRDKPWQLTQTELEDHIGGNRQLTRKTIARLILGGRIRVEKRPRLEGRAGKQRMVKRDVCGPADE